MKRIGTFATSHLHVASHVDYHKSCYNAMIAVGFNNAAWEKILDDYNLSIDILDNIVRRQKASIYTGDVHNADVYRDSTMKQLFLLIDAGAKSAVPTEKEAGKKLQTIIKPYRKDDRDQLTDQTEQVRSMITALGLAAVAPLVETLLLGAIIERLDKQNEAFAEIYRLRASDRMSQPGYGVNTAVQRKATDYLYNSLVEIINSVSVASELSIETGLNGASLNTLIDAINAYIAQYKLVLANQAKEAKATTEARKKME